MTSQVDSLSKSNCAQLVSKHIFNHRVALLPDGYYSINELGSDRPVIEFHVKRGKIYRD